GVGRDQIEGVHERVEAPGSVRRGAAHRAGGLDRALDVGGCGLVLGLHELDQVLERGLAHRAHLLGAGFEGIRDRVHATEGGRGQPFGYAERVTASSSRREASATSSTAPLNASSFRFEGARYPLTLRTNCRAASRISVSVAG